MYTHMVQNNDRTQKKQPDMLCVPGGTMYHILVQSTFEWKGSSKNKNITVKITQLF